MHPDHGSMLRYLTPNAGAKRCSNDLSHSFFKQFV